MPGNPANHFGKQVKKERLARGWSLDAMSARSGIAASHLSRIENGKRPPTERIATKCDDVFPERDGYFLEHYQESRTWMPPGFREWAEHESKTSTLKYWSPTVVTGPLQTERYAERVLQTEPGATAEMIRTRLANHMDRQRRLFAREVRACFVLGESCLSRLSGTPEIMAEQLDHLLKVAARPNVTVQLLPHVVHPATASSLLITDTAAYTEHLMGGYVYTDPAAVMRLEVLFDALRAECRPASNSAAVIRELRDSWAAGECPATRAPTTGK